MSIGYTVGCLTEKQFLDKNTPSIGIAVNTPPAKAGGFGLRLKAGSVGHSADCCRYTT